MNGMPKVLVVDNGERAPDSALSAELAGMGYASVTTPFEAADDVLALIPSPAAVVLQMPHQAGWAERRRFLDLASRLRKNLADRDTPVIITGGVPELPPCCRTSSACGPSQRPNSSTRRSAKAPSSV